MTEAPTRLQYSRYWEIKDQDNFFFAVGPTELEAWINLLNLKGKSFTMQYLMMMVKGMKYEGETVAKEIIGSEEC